jgi:subtilisin-like proprotein convertase family protein
MRIHFNVFCNTDGTTCAATQASVDAQVVQLNADFAPSKIEFCYTTEFINNTTYRQFADSEETAMKNAYADLPGTQLNVYVVNITAGYLGVGTFPWDADALGNLGGLIIDDNWFGSGQKTLTHEVGHCVGLWHTHHGVSEVTACSACYERADGLNGDTTGDFAGDTAPTPTNFNCTGPGGTDSCSATAWGLTDPQNYMGYAPDSCYTEYSPHQFGRMHCWSEQVLTVWGCGPIIPDGGCCVAQSCSIQTLAACTTAGGTYLGDNTDCAGTPGLAHTYSGTANLAIPDGGGSANPATHTITVPDSFTIGDVDVRNTVTHTWVGDVSVTLQHGTTTVTLVDRPGYAGSGFGCSADNFSNIALDDEGTLSIEGQCVTNLTSPPNYTPNAALSAFDGQNSSGTWTLRVYDSATSDTGTFNSWSVVISEVGVGPCAAGCTTNAQCDDGLFCNGTETCVTGACQAGTAPNCADAVACTTDACDEATDTCTHTANNAACSDGLFCNGSETCNVTLGCQAGTAPNCADAVACTTDSCNETTDTCDHTANNAACSDGLFCNGSETCSVTLGCQAGTNPCGAATCDEATDTCTGGQNIWIVFTGTTTVPGVGTVENEDIVSYNTATGLWTLIFDGSDVGLSALAIDGLARLSNGDILYSTSAAGTVAGLIGGPSTTSIDDSDIVRFTPTTLGATTAGTHTFYFDGSDVGLTTNDEDVDAIALNSSGQLVISTLGVFSVTGLAGEDEDLIIFTSTALGSVTSGSYAMHFDGSDVGLSTTTSEDVDAAGITPTGTILLSTLGSFSVTGATGADEDVFQFTPTTLGTNTAGSFAMFLDLSTIGISTAANINAVELVP